MKFKKEIFQILTAIILVAVVFTSFSWISIHYQNPAESAKETLSIAVSFMGVLATIFAALIAVLLFNDWRETERFNIAKETLIVLIKLKSHIDTNYDKAKFHLKAYKLKDLSEPPSASYISQRIEDAKNSITDKENYKSTLETLLAELFEKINIYEAVSDEIIIKEQDKDFNFQSFMYFISMMYTHAYKGNLQDIETTDQLSDGIKKRFEENFYNEIFSKLKNKALI
ncbi:hypothetical protein ACNPQK_08560 [Acinetobacter guillouiae]|uniref:hypothetical protein n=1 Tax=Acinetobacter guillouiae TaxID=106649 RepID=UPI003AF9F9E5